MFPLRLWGHTLRLLTEQGALPRPESDSELPAGLVDWKDWCEGCKVKIHVLVLPLMVEAANSAYQPVNGLNAIHSVKFAHFPETPGLCEWEPLAV